MASKRSVSYEAGLVERLKDPDYAATYLNAHLADSSDGETAEEFLTALRDVATAQGIGGVAKKAKLGRESLYKMLSKTGNPKLSTLAVVLKTLGLQLVVEARPKKKRA